MPAPAGTIHTCAMLPELRQDHPGNGPKSAKGDLRGLGVGDRRRAAPAPQLLNIASFPAMWTGLGPSQPFTLPFGLERWREGCQRLTPDKT